LKERHLTEHPGIARRIKSKQTFRDKVATWIDVIRFTNRHQ
jgi:hypothetical protein